MVKSMKKFQKFNDAGLRELSEGKVYEQKVVQL